MRPLKKCCNGCEAPPHAPSLVLCKTCFDKLGLRFKALSERGMAGLREIEMEEAASAEDSEQDGESGRTRED